MQLYIVPLMLLASSALMAFAWLGHIRFRGYSYVAALFASWILVLPEWKASRRHLEIDATGSIAFVDS